VERTCTFTALDFSGFFPRNKQTHLNIKLRKANLRNLGGLAATGLANNNGSGVSLNHVENGCAVLIHREPLSLLLHTRIPESTTQI
jgi:hypothetical protein